ncbi:MAG TPA: ABC transporter ATP-binding protein, partial [Thermodesulfobacteriota bacterium]|nr:ABC transporter ATP-binding protein [Thermodesulfobacteriota bacterium]
ATIILDTQRDLKTTYIVITHDIPLTYKIADKIAMLHEGKIVEQGAVDYMKNCQNPILRQFLEGRAEGPIKVM